MSKTHQKKVKNFSKSYHSFTQFYKILCNKVFRHRTHVKKFIQKTASVRRSRKKEQKKRKVRRREEKRKELSMHWSFLPLQYKIKRVPRLVCA
jgi:predicted RNase H-like nuclease (RuvC/YqgF family)